MTAKELIEAATRLREEYGNWRYVEAGSLYGRDVIASCDHILATVRPDDDEPVTRERLEADGWVDDGERLTWKRGIFTVDFTASDNPRAVLWVVGMAAASLKSMGHLRRLVAALGE